MNTLAAVFAGSPCALPHVTWPIEPHGDESLAGFIGRTADHNGLRDPSALLADAGLGRPKGFGRIARHAGDLEPLATLLAVQPAWVESHRHDACRDAHAKNTIDFHGALLRKIHVDHSVRRVGPTAIRTLPYHREVWHIRTLAACTQTGELLLENCPEPGCGASLAWSGHKRLGRCSDPECPGGTATSPTSVPDDQRPGIALAAGLLSSCTATRSRILSGLPASLRHENRGHLFDLAWILGCLDRPDGLSSARDPSTCAPPDRAAMLACGAQRLAAWPGCLTDLLRRGSQIDDTDARLQRTVETIQGIVRRRTSIGRPADLLADQLEGISTNAFSSVVGRHLGLLTATEFARAAGLKNSRMAALQRSSLVPRTLFSEGGRDIALFLPADAADLRHRITSRVPAQAFGGMLGVGTDAIELLMSEGDLALDADPVVQLLWPEHHLDPSAAERLRERLEEAVKNSAPPQGSIRLATALQVCPAGEKPWPAIISAILARRLAIHRNEGRSLNLRRCMVSPEGVRTIRAFPPAKSRLGIRSEWLSFEDARERLAIAPNRLRSLTAAGRLPSSDSYSGMRYRRSEVDAVAATWVTITELREKLGGSTWLISAELRKAGLSVDEQGLVPRSAARTMLGLATI